MEKMTPKERVLGLFRRDPIDTMPIFSGLSMAALPALREAGLVFSQVHTRPDLMARAAVVSSRRMNFDCIVVPFDITILSEALGNRPNFYEDRLRSGLSDGSRKNLEGPGRDQHSRRHT